MKEIHTVDYLPTARGFWQPRLVIIIVVIIIVIVVVKFSISVLMISIKPQCEL